MFEVKFYLATEVLACEESRRNASKSDYLSSFNALRLRILKAAASAYLKEKGSAISLDLGNFVEQTALLKGYDRALSPQSTQIICHSENRFG
ncbi:putative surface anchored protein [Rhizobium pusense]|nr:putative surface anchored protein [Agrobacterium pusense]